MLAKEDMAALASPKSGARRARLRNESRRDSNMKFPRDYLKRLFTRLGLGAIVTIAVPWSWFYSGSVF